MRKRFFGEEASTRKTRDELLANVPDYQHHEIDIRDAAAVNEVFKTHGRGLAAIVHTAAQPSHDWAARDPQMDFTVNANGTLNLLEAARNFCPETPFVFTSTNKVYGDTPNRLPLRELALRWEIEPGHEYEPGISENMSIDQTKHSLFGASKVAADVLVQEYGRYFGMPTVCFRGGCLTGPAHAGTELHGFLSYLMKCTVSGRPYRVFGYKGKQVRDNIHSFDLVEAFAAFVRAPRVGGGLQHRREPPLQLLDARSDRALRRNQRPKTCPGNTSRTTAIGDHIWWISDVRKFREHYPEWNFRYGLREILEEIHASAVNASRVRPRHRGPGRNRAPAAEKNAAFYVAPQTLHDDSKSDDSVLLAFVFRSGHDPIGNRPDIHHDCDPVDREEEKSEARRRRRDQERETESHRRAEKYQEQADQPIAFVDVSESRDDAQHHRDHVAGLAFRGFKEPGRRGRRGERLCRFF